MKGLLLHFTILNFISINVRFPFLTFPSLYYRNILRFKIAENVSKSMLSYIYFSYFKVFIA